MRRSLAAGSIVQTFAEPGIPTDVIDASRRRSLQVVPLDHIEQTDRHARPIRAPGGGERCMRATTRRIHWFTAMTIGERTDRVPGVWSY